MKENKCNCNEPYDSEKLEGGYPACPNHDLKQPLPRSVWVKATQKLPGWGKIVRWKLDGKEIKPCDISYMAAAESPAFIPNYEWLDESAESAADSPFDPELLKVMQQADANREDFLKAVKQRIAEPARESDAVDITPMLEDLWDEHAEYIDDNIDSLCQWAGSTVVDKKGFMTVAAKLYEQFKKEAGNEG